MDYLRIVKLIYLADRKSIVRRGVPIVGGKYFAMRKGPAISEIMNFVGQRNAPGWAESISPRHGSEIRLQSEPVFTALSQSELDILDETVEEHRYRTTEELVTWCHEHCPEYEEVPANARKPIQVESILHAEHKSERQIQRIVHEAESIEKLDGMLA